MSPHLRQPHMTFQSWSSGTLHVLDGAGDAAIRDDVAPYYLGLVLDLWLSTEGRNLSEPARSALAHHALRLRREPKRREHSSAHASTS